MRLMVLVLLGAFQTAALPFSALAAGADEPPSWERAWRRGREALAAAAEARERREAAEDRLETGEAGEARTGTPGAGAFRALQPEIDRLEAAHGRLRRAAALHPWHDGIRRKRRQAVESLRDRHATAGRRALDAGRLRAARRHLARAAELAPPDPAFAGRLRRLGLEPRADEWLHGDDVRRREKAAALDARRRRRELELPEGFRLVRRADVRVWTDVPGGRRTPVARHSGELAARVVEAYRELFVPLEPPRPEGGIDIIIFAGREAYEGYTGRPGTAGVFLPGRRASCFWYPERGRGGERLRERRFREALVHEVAHQLDARILGIRHPDRWWQEGLAMHLESLFRAGPAGPDGLPPPSPSLERALARHGPGGGEWWGLERILTVRPAAALAAEPAWQRAYYAQAWLLVRFLLGAAPDTRALFFEHTAAQRQRETPDAAGADAFAKRLAARGTSLETLEARLRRFWKERED